MKTVINVIDEVCGVGKSHFMLNEIAKKPDEKWIWVTPYLDEAGCDDSGILGRVRESLPNMNFRTPSAKVLIDGSIGNKSKHLIKLLEEGANISMTHNLFTNISKEALEAFKLHKYNLVIDEVIEKVEVFDSGAQRFSDIRQLMDWGHIIRNPDGRLDWIAQPLSVFKEEYELCQQGLLYLFNDRLLIKRHHSHLYELAKSVTVMTYRFEHSVMRVWADANGLKWTRVVPTLRASTKQRKQQIRGLVEVVTKENQDMIKLKENGATFSSSWFSDRASADDLKTMKKFADALYTRWYKSSKTKTKSAISPEIMFSVFKDYQKAVCGKGTRAGIDSIDTNFVVKNARAFNHLTKYDHMIYWCNVYLHVSVNHYLKSIVSKEKWLDEDEYALSELIQWFFRSAVRKNKPVKIYIASDRMRSMFIDWLNADS
jgi:hypothetical protein